MRIKSLRLLIIICSSLGIFFFVTQKDPEPPVDFFDVTFLQRPSAVQKILQTHGFFEVNFMTHDNLMINGIMLNQYHERQTEVTILSCSGFYPGRKEGMTTLYAMLKDKPYNFLFFDARGHGKSQGEMLTFKGIRHYGESEYLDVIAALQFLASYNKAHGITNKIIIHGLCSGAFHTIKAVADLKKSDPETYQCVQGIVIDSGWSAIIDITESSIWAESKKICKKYNLSLLQPLVAGPIIAFYRIFFKDSHYNQASIIDNFSEIDQPLLFIHAIDDEYVPIHLVHPLVETSQQPSTWFVKDSSHVSNHLKYQDQYKTELSNFIKLTI